MKISLLTPTLDRANLLPRLYESICSNVKNYKNVEWLIMDDGSTDDTKKIVSKWQKEGKVEIKYYYQSNSGKMGALNNLVEHVTGDIIIEIDSDDYLADNCLVSIASDYKKVMKDDDIYGILYLKKIIGLDKDNKFPFENRVISLYNLYYKYNYQMFDTAITFKANIRKKFKHKLESGEKFVTEAKMYHEMDKQYKGLYLINRDIMICEYQDAGYSKNILTLFKNNPYGYFEYFKELLSFNMKDIIFKKRLYMIKHYILFCTLIRKGYIFAINNVHGFFNKLLVIILYLPGMCMTKLKIK